MSLSPHIKGKSPKNAIGAILRKTFSNFHLKQLLIVIHYSLFLCLAIFTFYFNRFPYTDDWIYIDTLNITSLKGFISWLFSQHVDHRIPLQKLIHFSLAKATGFDFRILIFFNLTLALLTSILLTYAAQLYRGKPHFGDIVIPLIILNPIAGYFNWAFQLQQLSSVFCVSGALYFWLKYSKTEEPKHFAYALLFMSITPFCGMNGAIFSTVIVAGIFFFCLLKRKTFKRHNTFLKTALVLLLIENLAIWFFWTPSEATREGVIYSEIARFFLRLLPSSMFHHALNNYIYWKIGIFLLGLIIAAIIIYQKIKINRYLFSDFIITLTLFTNLLVILAISLGRSGAQEGWNDLLISHYGNLTLLIPILIWLLISSHFTQKTLFFSGFFLLVVFGLSYIDNFQLRTKIVNSTFEKQIQMVYELNHTQDLKKFVSNHPFQFTWGNSPQEQESVSIRLEMLRNQGYLTYKFFAPNLFYIENSRLAPDTINSSSKTVNSNQIQLIEGWVESGDFYRSVISSHQVLGSYVSSDADVGSLTLSLKRGQQLFFRSGPSTQQQNLTILFDEFAYDYPLPISTDWTVIHFDSPELPDTFTAVFHDRGQDWGEWSAIAVVYSKEQT
jgi:hypothetical protein